MPTPAPVTEVSLRTAWEALVRRRRLIALPTLALTILACAIAVILPARYRARAHVAADPLVPQAFAQPGHEGHAPDAHADRHVQLRRMKEVLFSRGALESVIRQFKLYPAGKDPVREKYLEAMKERLQVQAETDGDLYVVFEGGSRQEATDVANRLAQVLVEQTGAVRDDQATQAGKIIDGELQGLRQKLSEQERRIHDYKLQAGLAAPDRIETSLKLFGTLQEQIEHRNAALADEEAERSALAQEVRELKRQGAGRSESRELQELRLRAKQAQSRYTQEHPERIAVERQLRALEASRGSGVTGEASPTYLRYVQARADLSAKTQRVASYRNELEALQGQLQAYQQRIESSPQHERALAELTRDYDTLKTQYQELLGKKHQATLGYALDRVSSWLTFRVVEPAALPIAPFAPHRTRIVFMGLLAGLGLGLILAFVLEQSDTSVATLDELQAFTRIPTLAMIPLMDTDTSIPDARGGPSVALLTHPKSILAEQYRILAHRVHDQAGKTGPTVLAVTSAVGGEGKTTVAINLALALARTSEGRVLLVDADLRKPRVSEYLEITASRGFSHALQQPPGAGSDEGLHQYLWRLKELYVLPGAGSVPDPVGALSSERTVGLLTALRRDFQVIVLDAPPVLPIADTEVLSRIVDGLVFVLRANRTPRELLKRSVEGIDASKVLGIVLNGVDVQRSRYAAAYEYYRKCYLT